MFRECPHENNFEFLKKIELVAFGEGIKVIIIAFKT